LELFEFSLYGIYSQLFSSIFFASSVPALGLFYSFSIFAVGFLARPIGALILGHIGDKYGRIKALLAAALLMSISTFAIGLLPTYQQIGILAPIALLILRIAQGLSVGGEYVGANVYLSESLTNRRELAGAIVAASGMSGTLFAIFLSFLSFSFCEGDWKWRVPFLFSILIGVVGLYIRFQLQETKSFSNAVKQGNILRYPFWGVVKNYPKNLFSIFLIGGTNGILTFTLIVYMNVFVTTNCHLLAEESLCINFIAVIFFITSCLTIGYKATPKYTKLILFVLSGLMIGLSMPIYLLLLTKHKVFILLGEILLAIIAGGFSGMINSFMCSLLPVNIRYSGIAFGYSMGVAIFGGTVPIICNFLITYCDSLLAPSLYLVLGGFIGFLGIYQGDRIATVAFEQ
jgi:MHS family proline/betaine transporter-like MFS transporter